MTDKHISEMPNPPEALLDTFDPRFEPAHDLAEWAYGTFIKEGGSLVNLDHAHLRPARIGFLWTNASRVKKGMVTLGMAQLGEPSKSDGWIAGLHEMLRADWFGSVPDFLITIQANRFADLDAVGRCALVEHELYHCAQQSDPYGMPRFSRDTGRPLWKMRAHDVEEFVGVVRRYGAWSPALEEMQAVMERGPTIGRAKVEGVCGTCDRQI